MSNVLPNVAPGNIVSGGFTYPNNAQVVGDDLYIRDANGNQISGRSVSNGDKITVLDVGYTKQLVLVQYPAGSVVRQGYVNNVTSLIKYFHQGEWHNGSTSETVYDGNDAVIGSLDPHESATPLYKAGGKTHVVYNTSKGANTKSGYVVYAGGSSSDGGSTGGTTTGLVSDKLVDFVKSFEGFSDHAYDDGTGVMTIGYGTTDKDKVALGHCTEAQARQWLMDEINATASQVKQIFASRGVTFKQNEFDALCSFAYNCGTGAFCDKYEIFRNICSGVRDERIRENFLAWTGPASVKAGLTVRRNAECDMFLYGTYKNH